MKKYLLSSIVLAILLSGFAYAEVSSTNTNRVNEIKQKITNLKQELKNEIEIKIGKKLDVKKIQVANVFEKSIQNLKNLTARIESRMSKMEAESIDISSSKLLLETAKTKLALAETELTNLENILAEDLPVVSTSTSQNNVRKTLLKNIKLQSEKTKNSIKAAHKSIVEVVASLKKGIMKEKNSTSTTNN